MRAQLLAAHAAAVAEIVQVACSSKLAGESPRASVAAASRLLHEIVGQG